MKKGDWVVEIGDFKHIGVYCRRKGRMVLVRWHEKCATWHRRDMLREAFTRASFNQMKWPEGRLR